MLSGPNLDRLGKREPEIYGATTLEEIHALLKDEAEVGGHNVDCRQSNHEGVLIDWIGPAADEGFHGIVINPGALTHTSYALHDALRGVGIPSIEVHLSNPHAREEFRHHSTIAPVVAGRVAGFGAQSYLLGLRGLLALLAG